MAHSANLASSLRSLVRIIAHLDMDAFFAAVEERDNPQFAKLPIVVGAEPMGGKGRGVVSTANYAARTYGIQSAMPISTAWRLAQQAKSRGNPEAVFLPVDMEKYIRVSRQIMQILAQFSAQVEQVSVDEAYLDLSTKSVLRLSLRRLRAGCRAARQSA